MTIKNLPWSFDDQAQYDNWTNDLLKNCPESWEASEGSAESIITEYLHALENRVISLGGSLEKEYGKYKATKTPRWKVLGFKSKKEMKDFEDRTDFPGWDYL